MKYVVVWLMIACQILCAEEEQSVSLVNMTKSPISRIAGSVNVISGNFVDQVSHLDTTGPEKYSIAHSYVSSSEEEGSIADGWDFYHPTELEIYQPKGLAHGDSLDPTFDNEAIIYYRDAGGATIVFKGDNKAKHFKPQLKKTGYTFVSSIESPVRRDVRRIRIWKESHSSDVWIVVLGDGTLRRYVPVKKQRFRPTSYDEAYYRKTYHIEAETLPSGNKRLYTYHRDHNLYKIETVGSDGTMFHFAKFFWKKDAVHIETSEKKSVIFSLKRVKHRDDDYIVTKIDRPGKSALEYSYSDYSKTRVKEKKSASGSLVHAKFYHDGKNDVGGEKVDTSHKYDFFKNRVKELWTKAFIGEDPFCSHAFYYTEWDEHTRTRVKEEDGSSRVFIWDKKKRPLWISYLSQEHTFLMAEHFSWGENQDEGRLLNRVVLDENQKPIFAREWIYDEDGNVIEEHLRGSFTGRNKSLSWNKKKELSGGETIVSRAKYNDKGLKISETDALGNKTYFEYEKNRDLLTARFTCDGKHIIRREFFSYDAAAIEIESIVDDGSSKNKDDMTSVHKRSVNRVKPRKKIPRYGFPSEEVSLVWTPESNEYKLISRVTHEFDTRGRVSFRHVFDTTNTEIRLFAFSYDECDRLVRTKDVFADIEEIFAYDAEGLLVQKTTPHARVTYSYDLLNRLIEEKSFFSDGSSSSTCHQYDRAGREETIIDARGRTATKVKDIASRLIKRVGPELLTEEGPKRGEEKYSFSGATETKVFSTGALAETVFSGFGKPFSIKNTFGAITKAFYDEKGRVIEQIDPSGLVTLTSYDAFDRVVETVQKADGEVIKTSSRYEGMFLVEEVFPTKKMTYYYDEYGRKCRQVCEDLITHKTLTTCTGYDTLHRVRFVEQKELGIVEYVSYDAADREIEKKTVSLKGEALACVRKSYDRSGRVVEESIARGEGFATTKTTYGAFGCISSLTHPDGTHTRFSYDLLFRGEEGLFFLKKITTDERGVVTEELLDANDHPYRVTVKDPFGMVVSQQKSFVSLFGKPTLIEEDVIVQGQVQGKVKTKFGYDSVSQLIFCTQALGEKEEVTWNYWYDELGRKLGEKKPSGEILNSTYDQKSRLSFYTSSDGTISWRYFYNSQNLPEKIVNENTKNSTIRSYDGLGHITGEVLETGVAISYDVAATGFLNSITYPDLSKSNYLYQSGRLSSITRNGYTYAVNERDISGMITRATFGTTGEVTYGLDIMGRRTFTRHAQFSEERTGFDGVGLCTERKINGKREVFSYDALNQLRCDNGRLSTFDSLFRRVEHEGVQATHNARHQVTSQGDTQFTYDVDGRRVKDAKNSYFYDALDRLIAIEREGSRIEYTYDALHRRLSAIGNGKSEKYIWQGEYEIGSLDSTGRVTSLRVLGEGLGGDIGSSVLFEILGQQYIPLHDIAGHVRACLTLSGALSQEISYTAYGIESRSANLSPWTFSSKREDSETGFMYFGRRFYDSETGVWLTQDPLGFSAGPNLYAYVKNNPLMLFDLVGLEESGGGGFWSNFLDRVSDFFSGGGESSSSSSSSTATATASSLPESGSEVNPQSGPSERKRLYGCFGSDGSAILYSSDAKNRVVIHYAGSNFFEDNKGQNLTNRVVLFVNGMLMSMGKCNGISDQTMKDHKQIAAFVLLYNKTEGKVADTTEALRNLLKMPTKVVSELNKDSRVFFGKCKEYGITFKGIWAGWSQGAAIANHLLSKSEFQSGGQFEKFVGERANFGGAAVTPKPAINFVADGDQVPWLNPGNIGALMGLCGDKYDVRFLPRESSAHPHDFMGPEYKKAFDRYLSEQLGENK